MNEPITLKFVLEALRELKAARDAGGPDTVNINANGAARVDPADLHRAGIPFGVDCGLILLSSGAMRTARELGLILR